MIGDLRYAVRALARRPSFSLTAIAMLAIGITANTIVFTLIDSLVMRPKPVRDAARVVRAYPVAVVGVGPAEFTGTEPLVADVWLPIAAHHIALPAEAVVLAAIAGGAALLLSGWILRMLYALGMSLAPFRWTVALSLSPDVRVFAYTFALAMGAGVLFGLFPALQISSPRIASALHEDGTLLGIRVSRSHARNALVIAQLAGCVVLLVDAGLLARGLRNARALDLGFRADHVVYSEYDLRQLGYSASRAEAFNRSLLAPASRLPTVASIALTSHVPLHGGVRRTRVTFETGSSRESAWSIYSAVPPTYFDTLSIPIVEGRTFAAEDASAPVAIISEGLARRFSNRPTLGRRSPRLLRSSIRISGSPPRRSIDCCSSGFFGRAPRLAVPLRSGWSRSSSPRLGSMPSSRSR